MRPLRKLAKWMTFMIPLLGIGYGANGSSSSQLLLSIKSEVVLHQRGDDAVFVTIRLSPQNKATVWVQDRCESPQANSYIIAQSGNYLIPLSAIGSQGTANVCLSSYDGSLNTSLRVINNPAGHQTD